MSRTMKCTVTLAVVLAGCGGPATVDRAQVEKEAQTELSKSVGQQAPAATCPGDLDLEVGTTMRCHMDFSEEERLGITVKVESVDGSDGRLSFVADDAVTKRP
jgi:Domain of unknown function (DUF4333)